MKLYGKFLFEGQFLAFYKTEKTNELPVFFIKLADIGVIEDNYENKLSDNYIEYWIGDSSFIIKSLIAHHFLLFQNNFDID